MSSFAHRLWNASPASLLRAVSRRLARWRAQPAWHRVQAGPLAGAELLLDPPIEGGMREMIAGTFDAFLYDELKRGTSLQDAVCWDVGAHFGYHSLAFAALGAHVTAFEPNPHNLTRLRQNLERNPSFAARIRVHPLALADGDGETTFVQSADTAGGSSGSHIVAADAPCDTATYAHFERVPLRTARMDTLIRDGEPPPAVIKMDVEGAEWLALQGGRELLARHRPFLFVEVHHIRVMFHLQPFLAALGYELRLLDEEHITPSRCFLAARARP